MLPLLQANEIKRAVVDYLRSTFNFEDAALDQSFEEFLLNERRGMFKGPYMQLRLPFDKITSDSDKEIFEKSLFVKPPFTPTTTNSLHLLNCLPEMGIILNL